VGNELHNFNFSFQIDLIFLFDQLFFINQFESYLLSGRFMNSETNLKKGKKILEKLLEKEKEKEKKKSFWRNKKNQIWLFSKWH